MSSQPGTAATSPDPALPSYDPLFEDPSAPEPAATNSTATTTSAAGAAAHELAQDEAPARVPEPHQPAPVTAAAPATPSPWDAPIAPAAGGRAGRPVDTGRLYHSAGADGPATSEAIPALPLRRETAAAGSAVAAISVLSEPAASASAPVEAAVPAARPAKAQTGRGLTYLGVVAVVTVPTLLVGLVQAAMSHDIGWFTGLVLLVTSTYAALTVRRPDFAAAVVVPSLAFLVTTLVAGQFALESGGSRMVRESYMIFRTLAVNAPWILASTAIAAVIVLVRRRNGPLHSPA
ncbi:MAG TPA: DUF6542 domain-containing protein [Candidatus Nanopelagicales bacterium]